MVPASIVIGPGLLRLITGAVASWTVTVLVDVDVFPAASVAVYVTVYVPGVEVSTAVSLLLVTFTAPSIASVALEPGSV